MVQAVTCLNVSPVIPGLTDQVAAVAGGIDQDILRLLLQPAFNDCLQVLVVGLKILEGQIVHIDDKPVIAVLDPVDHGIQIMQLMLVQFDDTQATVIVLVEDRLDAGGLTGAGIPVEKNIIARSARHKGLGVFNQFFLHKELIMIHNPFYCTILK